MTTRIKDEALVERLRKNVSELKELINQCDINILSFLKICIKLTILGFYGVYSSAKNPGTKLLIRTWLDLIIGILDLEKQFMIKNKSFEEFAIEVDKFVDKFNDCKEMRKE